MRRDMARAAGVVTMVDVDYIWPGLDELLTSIDVVVVAGPMWPRPPPASHGVGSALRAHRPSFRRRSAVVATLGADGALGWATARKSGAPRNPVRSSTRRAPAMPFGPVLRPDGWGVQEAAFRPVGPAGRRQPGRRPELPGVSGRKPLFRRHLRSRRTCGAGCNDGRAGASHKDTGSEWMRASAGVGAIRATWQMPASDRGRAVARSTPERPRPST